MTGTAKEQISDAVQKAKATTGVLGVGAAADVIGKAGFGAISAAAETVNAAAGTGSNLAKLVKGTTGVLGQQALKRSENQETKAAVAAAVREGKVTVAQTKSEQDALKAGTEFSRAQDRAQRDQQKSTAGKARQAANDVNNSKITLFIDGANRGYFFTKKIKEEAAVAKTRGEFENHFKINLDEYTTEKGPLFTELDSSDTLLPVPGSTFYTKIFGNGVLKLIRKNVGDQGGGGGRRRKITKKRKYKGRRNLKKRRTLKKRKTRKKRKTTKKRKTRKKNTKK
jgi:hypothetical protein